MEVDDNVDCNHQQIYHVYRGGLGKIMRKF